MYEQKITKNYYGDRCANGDGIHIREFHGVRGNRFISEVQVKITGTWYYYRGTSYEVRKFFNELVK